MIASLCTQNCDTRKCDLEREASSKCCSRYCSVRSRVKSSIIRTNDGRPCSDHAVPDSHPHADRVLQSRPPETGPCSRNDENRDLCFVRFFDRALEFTGGGSEKEGAESRQSRSWLSVWQANLSGERPCIRIQTNSQRRTGTRESSFSCTHWGSPLRLVLVVNAMASPRLLPSPLSM